MFTSCPKSTSLGPPSITPRPQATISSRTILRSRFGGRTRWASFFAALQRPAQPETPLGVYLHIPFCRKRCHFCYFRVYTNKDSAAIKGYIDAALKELALYARQPVIAGRKPSFVYSAAEPRAIFQQTSSGNSPTG